jgi:uncharacterized surface protein with fasciclin (FAS1) repeats
MMQLEMKKIVIIALSGILFLVGCKKWESQISVNDAQLEIPLMRQLRSDPLLTTFTAMVERTGYDVILTSSQNFTVYAPSNAALASLDPAIAGDLTRLTKFVANHITPQTYYSKDVVSAQRIKMNSGKYNNIKGSIIEDANIVKADQYAKNGVIQIIDKPLLFLENTWNTLSTNATLPSKQKTYLLSLFGKVFDPSKAVQIGVNSVNGNPIYQAGTDSIQTNRYWRDVYDLTDESKQFTMFVLEDTAWDSEINKFKSYYATGTVDSTLNATSWDIVKDFAIEGLYNQTAIPDTLMSKFNVKVPVNKASIVRTIKTSNGIIYVMRRVSVAPREKFKSIVIQAENYRFQSADKFGVTYFRDRYNPIIKNDFRDMLVYNHGIALFNVNYRIINVQSVKYRAYWVAVNDFQTATFTQLLGIGTPTSTLLPYTNVVANNFGEVLLGEFTISRYAPFLDLYLTSANSTTAAVNPLVCDYIRLEPVIL